MDDPAAAFHTLYYEVRLSLPFLDREVCGLRLYLCLHRHGVRDPSRRVLVRHQVGIDDYVVKQGIVDILTEILLQIAASASKVDTSLPCLFRKFLRWLTSEQYWLAGRRMYAVFVLFS